MALARRATLRTAVILPVIAAAVAAATPAAATPAAARAAAPATAPPAPTVAWGSCGADAPAPFECGTLTVPLDHRRPGGPTIGIAVIRRVAPDPAARIGSLVLNPGGPGGSGIDYTAAVYDRLPAELRSRFDIVSFDPRGVARSSGIECWDRAQYDAAFASTQVDGPDRDRFGETVTRARRLVQACVREAGRLLPYVGTGYVARDLDLLRQAVGDQKLTFLGLSYGTFLGTVYADLFPHRVRALVLDGVLDAGTHARKPYEEDRRQSAALDGALDRFLAWCSANPAACGFGAGDAAGALDRLVRELDDNPRTVPTAEGPGTTNAAWLLFTVSLALNGGRPAWPALGRDLQAVQDGQLPPSAQPLPSFAAQFFSQNTVVDCVDRNYPLGLGRLSRALARNAAAGGRFGWTFAYGPPAYDNSHGSACAQWPWWAGKAAPSRHRGDFRAQGAPPVLLVGVTGDPDVPYQDAVDLARRLDRAWLVTLVGEGHTAFRRSACATEQTVRYLVHRTRPQVTVCTDDRPPG
jgi:pimeloyl-ACP methyl ester carboxylesterase